MHPRMRLRELVCRMTACGCRVFLYLVSRANEKGEAWPSAATIATDLGITDRGVRKTLAELRVMGLFTEMPGPGGAVIRAFTVDWLTALPPLNHSSAPLNTRSGVGTYVQGSPEPQFRPPLNHSSAKVVSIEVVSNEDTSFGSTRAVHEAEPTRLAQEGKQRQLFEEPAKPKAKLKPKGKQLTDEQVKFFREFEGAIAQEIQGYRPTPRIDGKIAKLLHGVTDSNYPLPQILTAVLWSWTESAKKTKTFSAGKIKSLQSLKGLLSYLMPDFLQASAPRKKLDTTGFTGPTWDDEEGDDAG